MTAGADAPRAGIGESNSRSSPVPPMQLDRASIVPGVADGDAEALLYSQTLAVGYKAMAWSHGRMVRLGTTLLPARGGSPDARAGRDSPPFLERAAVEAVQPREPAAVS